MYAELISPGSQRVNPTGYCGVGVWPHTPCLVGLNPNDGICKAGGCSIDV